MKKTLLRSLIERGITYGWEEIKKDVIAKSLNSLNIYGYKHEGYCAIIKTLEDYYKASMALLKPDVRNEIFGSRILTKIMDTVPTTYGGGNKVKNSFIADGCTIDGEVENSILFRDVKIARGSIIKDSVVMQGTVIEEGARLSHVIADKNVKITPGKALSGSDSIPFVISKGKVV